MFKTNKKNKGFTLIEILIVIGIIAVLATIVIIAINPARQFAQARNTQRVSNVNTILNALGQNIADNKGLLAGGCPALTDDVVYTIAKGGTPAYTPISPAIAVIDLSCLTPTYIPSQIPVDPSTGAWTSSTDYHSDYNVVVNAGRYTITAPKALLETAISATPPAVSVTR